jgi:hypothetical protein
MSNDSFGAERETSEGRVEVARAAVATILLAGLFAALGFAPRNDPAKTIAGLPCSVVSENEASLVLGTTVRLLPSTGTLCRYVSTGAPLSRALIVVARREDEPSLGNGTHVVGRSLYARRDGHTYVLTVVGADGAAALADERTLAGALGRTDVARSR